MKAIALVFIIVLVTAIVPGTVYAAETTPVYPGMGSAPVEILTNMYPTVKGNAPIMGFIRECGVGSWHEEGMNADFKSARLFPANSCGKQLVFSIRKSVGRDDPTQIGNVWIIGVNETWSSTMDTVPVAIATPVYPGMGAPVDALNGRHSSVKGNPAIQEYIRECGVGRWNEKKMDTGFISVLVPPGNSCGKKLVFLAKMAGGYDDPATQIIAVWILGANETWSDTMDPVYPSVWDYRIQGLLAGASKVPPVFMAGVVIALALICIAFALIGRGK
jgi:hypothetical protein